MPLADKMLFVGIGGTGCAVGSEIEALLRQDLCGPDGRKLQASSAPIDVAPYQLPASTQFIYVDIDEDSTKDLAEPVSPQVWNKTAATVDFHLSLTNSRDVTRQLRGRSGLENWLPDTPGEPEVAPLSKGAGQMPMVGRSALFHAIINAGGVTNFMSPVTEAVDRLSKADPEHVAVGGLPNREVSVFLVYSIAGGTGCGMFYDLIHLLSYIMEGSNVGWTMYPIVLMPSAFDGVVKDTRYTRLNGASALSDLSRLLDSQNTGRPLPGITYPGLEAEAVRVQSAKVQTAMLFARTTGVELADLQRSIATFVLSLVSTGTEGQQTFAQDFVNAANDRAGASRWGVGKRSLSTTLSASLTIPREAIAQAVADRLLARGLDQLRHINTINQDNSDEIKKFANVSGLGNLIKPPTTKVAAPDPGVKGAAEVHAELSIYHKNAEQAVAVAASKAKQELASKSQYQYSAGVVALLNRGFDWYRIARILKGVKGHPNKLSELGAFAAIADRVNPPPTPDGVGDACPIPPPLHNTYLGLKRTRLADSEVQRYVENVAYWVDFATRAAWSDHWQIQTPIWQRVERVAIERVESILEELDSFARGHEERFRRVSADLYAPRTGVSYLLPAPSVPPELGGFYDRTLRSLAQTLGQADATELEAALLTRLLEPTHWEQAWNRTGARSGPALPELLGPIKAAILAQMEQGLLPPLGTQLGWLADGTTGSLSTEREESVVQLRSALMGMMPDGFEPDGHVNASFNAAVNYPGSLAPDDAQAILEPLLNTSRVNSDYSRSGADALTFTMARSELGVLDTRETRSLYRHWLMCQRNPKSTDFLPWRRRISNRDGWLLTESEDRELVTQKILNLLWNGAVEISGAEGQPHAASLLEPVEIRLDVGDGILLKPERVAGTSSWGDLLGAYERSITLAVNDQLMGQACEELLNAQVDGIASTPAAPSAAYLALLDYADNLSLHPGRLQDTARNRQIVEFWYRTLPNARKRKFVEIDGQYASHDDLFAQLVGES